MNRPQIITRVIPLTFIASSISRPVNINIPFRVGTIRTKSCVYTDATEPVAVFDYYFLTSDLVKGQTLGVVANDYRYASTSNAEDITYKSQQPQDINGSYNFNIFNIVGNPQSVSGFALLILEFTEAEQTALNNF